MVGTNGIYRCLEIVLKTEKKKNWFYIHQMCVMMLRALFRILWVVFTISGDLYELDDEKTFLSFSLTVHHFLGTVATVISRLCFYFLFIYLFIYLVISI